MCLSYYNAKPTEFSAFFTFTTQGLAEDIVMLFDLANRPSERWSYFLDVTQQSWTYNLQALCVFLPLLPPGDEGIKFKEVPKN